MTQPRDPRINALLTLLGDITQESSLAYMADMPNPRGVQDNYRKLWKLYSEHRTARILTFLKGGAPARNRQCNTWLVDSNSTVNAISVLCSECKEPLKFCLQIDTSDFFFEEGNKTHVLHMYACTKGHEMVVLTPTETVELTSEQMDTTWCVRKWHTIADHATTNLNIIVADASKCEQCIDTPYILTERNLKAREGTKAGGETTERYFKPYTNVLYNKALFFKDAKIRKLAHQTAGKCECFTVTRATQLLILHHTDLPPLDDLSISEIRLYCCDECDTPNMVIYSQELEVGYSSIILDVKDYFYHVLRTEDVMNGIVIAVDKTSPSINGICRLGNFYYNEGKKHDILYTNILPLQEEHKSFLSDLAIDSGDNFNAFMRFMKSYEGNPSGEEDELILEHSKDPFIVSLGEGYYVGGKKTLLENCVLYMENERKITLHGQLPCVLTEPLQLQEPTPVQKAYGLKLNLIIAPLNVKLHISCTKEEKLSLGQDNHSSVENKPEINEEKASKDNTYGEKSVKTSKDDDTLGEKEKFLKEDTSVGKEKSLVEREVGPSLSSLQTPHKANDEEKGIIPSITNIFSERKKEFSPFDDSENEEEEEEGKEKENEDEGDGNEGDADEDEDEAVENDGYEEHTDYGEEGQELYSY